METKTAYCVKAFHQYKKGDKVETYGYIIDGLLLSGHVELKPPKKKTSGTKRKQVSNRDGADKPRPSKGVAKG